MNIRELAKVAGVSVATVSRVLNHPQTVAPETKDKILALMEELDYKPNWFARGLNLNKTETIGLMIPNILNPSHMITAKGIEDVAHQKGYSCFMCNFEHDQAKERKYLESLIQKKVDGLIFISSFLTAKDFHSVKSQNIPFVLIGESSGENDVYSVKIDCVKSACMATKHLLDIGYKDIALVRGLLPEIENSKKSEGYIQAMAMAEVFPKESWQIKAENSIEGGYIAGKKLIELEKPPRAVFATSDILALGILDAMRDNGVRVPEEMAIVGFDNIRTTNIVEPKLTTVDNPLHKSGVMGARLLFDLIENQDVEGKSGPPKEIILKTKLKIRKSCGHNEVIGEMF